MRSLTPWRRRRISSNTDVGSASAHPLRRSVAEYCAAALAEGASPETVRTQRQLLVRFAAWAATRGIDAPSQVSRRVLEDYQLALHAYRKRDGGPLSVGAQLVALAALKAWLKWLVRKDRLDASPADWLRLPRHPPRLPATILSEAAIERIANLADTGTPLGIRDRAILETLYSCGIRRAELVHLSLADVGLEDGTLMIRSGKGRRDRMVPLGETAAAWITRYLAETRPLLHTGEAGNALFIDELGRALTPRYLGDLVRRYFQHAGVSARGACHLFRHAMATHMLDNGADIRHIQAILGHARLETTQIYTRVSLKKLKEVHAATHPSARRRK